MVSKPAKNDTNVKIATVRYGVLVSREISANSHDKKVTDQRSEKSKKLRETAPVLA